MTESTIYHLEFHSGAHHYFGSITAMLEVFDARTLKVSQGRLYNYQITPDKPYRNSVCVIRKGVLHRQKQKNNREKMN